MTGSQYGAVHGVFEPRRNDEGTYAALARPLLAPDEPLRGIVAAELHNLVRRLPRRHRGKDEAGPVVIGWAALEIVTDLFGALVDLVLELPGLLIGAVRRLVRGRALVGGWRSTAGRLAADVRRGPSWCPVPDNDEVLLVFTDGRILLAAEGKGGLMEFFGELPRAELRRVTVRHTWISNRVDLRFADGSLLAVEAGLDNARALEALVRD
ncbi:hypothetical protein [Kitasatospora terrestris]|uniref:Uncharacterized protein n=1 Tax=Kitasatospora terrestris TaxID=258051 RepID=A0ABP9E8L9_9ACTN